jgi:hypothetical protein
MPDSRRLLELALKGLEAEQANIDDEIAQIKGQLNPRRAVPDEAMKRRYAEMNRAGEHSHVASQVRTSALVSPKQSTVKKQNGGDRLTAAGRKKLSDLMKKRWADKRAGPESEAEEMIHDATGGGELDLVAHGENVCCNVFV